MCTGYQNHIYLDSPLVETTPFVFNGKVYLLENWRKMWDYPIELEDYPLSVKTKYLTKDIAKIRDIENCKTVSFPLVGFGFCSAFVFGGRVYVFGSRFNNDKVWDSKEIWMTSSKDLRLWSHPECVSEARRQESFFNVNICRKLNNKGFVMLVETDEPNWVKFTFRFLESSDLLNWQPIEGAVYGKDKYVGGPAIYNVNGFYYVCYLDEAEDGWVTRLTRSKDLTNWQDAPREKPVLVYNEESGCHRLRGKGIKEKNASDLEMCEFDGKTLMYFTGGDQLVCGNLQRAEFSGTMADMLESFYC